MPQQAKLSIRGLYTNPNTLSEVPDGALAVADNIVVDRESVAESRRGFKQYNDALDDPQKIFNFRDTLLVHDDDKIKYDDSGTWTAVTGTFEGPAAGRRIQGLQANKNFYFTSDQGVQKMEAPDADPRRSGAPRGLDLATSLVAGTFFAEDTSVAYRVVWGYLDANQNLILGAPSGRSEISNPAASGANAVELNFTIPAEVTVDYIFQIYRSLMSVSDDVPGDDELQLAIERHPTAGEITAGVITITDDVPEDLLGVALYTNSTQEGILQANDRPPYAIDIATFRDHTFYFNTKQPHRVVLTMIDPPTIGDTVEIAGETYTAAAAENIVAQEFQTFSTGNQTSDVINTITSLIRVLNRDTNNVLVYGYYVSEGTFYIEARDFGASFDVDCSVDTVFQQAVPITSTDDAHANRLYISKSGRPEAVPLLQYVDVGRADKDGLRILSVRDALFPLKEDGAFRVTGTNTSNFIVEQHDTTFEVIAPEAAVAFANTVFCTTNQGALAINVSGVEIISRMIENELKRIITLTNFDTLAWAAGYDSDRKYILGVPQSGTSTDVDFLLVYNSYTASWTKWTVDWKHALVGEADDKLYSLRISDGQSLQERKDLTWADYADDEFAVTITSGTATTATVSSVANLAVGMTLKQGTRKAPILAINGLVLTTDSSDFDWVAGPAIVYMPILVRMRWTEDHAGNPGILKHYGDIMLMFEKTRFRLVDLKVSSNFKGGFRTTELASVSLGGWGSFPFGRSPWGTGRGGFQSIRTYFPREVARGIWVNLEIEMEQAFSSFALAGASYTYNVMSSRFK